MNFFENQAYARRKSRQLLTLFAVSVVAFIALLNFVFLVGLKGLQIRWTPDLIPACAGISLAALLLILGASLWKWRELHSKGGRLIAESLGAKKLSSQTTDFHEKRLQNIVEEMSIAAGIPVPDIYLLEEQGINAFAAGYSSHDMVIGVTRASLQQLSRDELQGVIAHEFSHIFHGDMKLNMNLMGVLHGIFVFFVLGRQLIFSRSRSSRNRKSGGIAVIGLGLMLAGGAGLLMGRLIQAAVSRQREFLADASAVQYTRNPEGILGALKKLFSSSARGEIKSPKVTEMSHFLFCSPKLKQSFVSFFSTHPPLEDRIRAIDPASANRMLRQTEGRSRPPELSTSFPSPTGLSSFSQATLASVGGLHFEELDQSARLLDRLSDKFKEACRDPARAKLILLYLFEKRPPESELSRQIPFQELLSLGDDIKLPVFDLCIPALRELPPAQREELMAQVRKIILQDQKIELSEFALFKTLVECLQFSRRKKKIVGSEQDLVSSLLSAMAHCSQESDSETSAVFQKAWNHYFGTKKGPGLQELDLKKLNEALDFAKQLEGRKKQKLFEALFLCASANGRLNLKERELLRAVSESIDIPLSILRKEQNASTS